MGNHFHRILWVYLMLVIIPMVPVMVLYLTFGSTNYFGLDGWIKGVLASGPIGAYFFMLHIGFRYFRDLMLDVYPERIAEAERYVGEWDFESETLPSKKSARGLLVAGLQGGQLAISGKLIGQEGSPFGEVTSQFCHIDPIGAHFSMLYKSVTVDSNGVQRAADCYCSMFVTKDGGSPSKMDGTWLQLSASGRSNGGKVIFQRAAKVN